MGQMPDVYAAEPIPAAAMAEIACLLETGDLFRYTTEASPVARLESEFAAFLGSRFALAVSSCSAALFLSLKALDLARGAHVLVPAFTFAAVPSAVIHADCTPVLVEVGDDLRIDLDDFARKLPGAGAAMISHMRGHTSDMDAILRLCRQADVPVIEDAAHSLGTLWDGRPIGTLGRVGCFSFQSYKLVNSGEGGMLVTDDAELAARTVIMSGAYEQNWKKHAVVGELARRWQNRLPLYNMRLQNLSAAILRPQVPLIPARAEQGRRNHDLVAGLLNASPWLSVPPPLPKELRAPDSLQFLLRGFSDAEALALQDATRRRGLAVQVFGLSEGNARAFWNWGFLADGPLLPKTRAMLNRTCDTRLPSRLTATDCRRIAEAILAATAEVKAPLAVAGA